MGSGRASATLGNRFFAATERYTYDVLERRLAKGEITVDEVRGRPRIQMSIAGRP
jgi:hypothetical protein